MVSTASPDGGTVREGFVVQSTAPASAVVSFPFGWIRLAVPGEWRDLRGELPLGCPPTFAKDGGAGVLQLRSLPARGGAGLAAMSADLDSADAPANWRRTLGDIVLVASYVTLIPGAEIPRDEQDDIDSFLRNAAVVWAEG
jgi:hypothetical protein